MGMVSSPGACVPVVAWHIYYHFSRIFPDQNGNIRNGSVLGANCCSAQRLALPVRICGNEAARRCAAPDRTAAQTSGATTNLPDG